MQKAEFRIWTRVFKSTFFKDNSYATNVCFVSKILDVIEVNEINLN